MYTVRRFISKYRKGKDRPEMEEIEISNVSLGVLQSIFGEPEAELMYAVYPIKPRHAKALQRCISVPFDLQKFDYFLEAEKVT